VSMDYIRRTYGVPARRGARVQYDGVTVGQPPLLGTITSATNSGHIRVRFDGERRTHKLHPTWALVYLKTPNVRAMRATPARDAGG
jgi:hypothetical protein